MKREYSLLKTIITGLLVVYIAVMNLSVVVNATEETQVVAPAPEAAAQEATATRNSRTSTASAPAASSESGSAILEIQDYTVASGSIEAGENAEIEVNLHNLSNTVRASGVVLTFSSDSGKLFPSFGNDNQIFVGSIAAGGTATVTIPITISSSFTGEYIDLTCRIDYETNNKDLRNNATIILPAAYGAELYVQSVGLSSKATVNSNTLLSINYANRSKKNIDDAVLIINGNVTNDSSRIKLGSVYAEKSYMKDYHITFTEVGQQDISISISYTNANGEAVTTEIGNYTVDVSEQSESGNTGSQVSGSVVLAGKLVAVLAAIIALIAVIVYIKRR